ncbi:Na(+)/citrate cotransporter-like [Eucyclogobius newberryi]|uniref:Na(+)/citrate cotransporter-like n=1 Tax=Eucyclogobius newberryi TaxID=166745 RepID=UPI003B5B663B
MSVLPAWVRIVRRVWSMKTTFILVLTPILLLPLATSTKEAACAYVMALMAVYWCTEALPLAVTALMPTILFPLLGVMQSRDVCVQYLKDTNFLFVGGLLVAVAVEHWDVHKRIALRVLLMVGVRPALLMLGFMLVTAFLSMWISNTATTAMMVPIVQAVLDQLQGPGEDQLQGPGEDQLQGPGEDQLQGPGEDRVQTGTGPETHPEPKTVPGSRAEPDSGDKVQLEPEDVQCVLQSRPGPGVISEKLQSSAPDQSQQSDLTPPLPTTLLPLAPPPPVKLLPPAPPLPGKLLPTAQPSSVVVSLELEEVCDGDEKEEERLRRSKGLLLSVCYAASIGGIATLTGTGPNLVLVGQMSQLFPQNKDVINFASWFIFAFPTMILMLLLAWLWLQLLYVGCKSCRPWRCGSSRSQDEDSAFRLIQDQHRSLGPISFAQCSVLLLFSLMVALWFTREPRFMDGWATHLFNSNKEFVTDATVALFVAVLLFIFPSEPPSHLCFWRTAPSESSVPPGPAPALLTWGVAQRKMPWNIMLLLGGGFALAKGSEQPPPHMCCLFLCLTHPTGHLTHPTGHLTYPTGHLTSRSPDLQVTRPPGHLTSRSPDLQVT